MRYLTLFAFILLAGVGIAIASDNFKPAKIDAEALQALQKSGEPFVLIDSRGGKFFDGEVIQGAVHLSVEDQDVEKLAKIVPDKNTKLVFYCSNTACQASEFAGYKASADGYTKVYKYPGGIEEWKQKGLPTEKSVL